MIEPNTRRMVCLLLLGLFIVIPLSLGVKNRAEVQGSKLLVPKQEIVVNSPVTISGNNDFEIQGWAGSGTEEDPYVIADLNIRGAAECIIVENTDVYFVIRNCSVEANDIDDAVGILLTGVKNAILDGCSASDAEWGIRLENCSNCEVVNCRVYNNNIGVIFQGVFNSMLRDTATHGCNFGVAAQETENCEFQSNRIFGNKVVGISLGKSTNRCIVFGNSIGWNDAWSVSDDARDNGHENQWNESTQGNEWHGYNDTGTYPIAGNASSVDYYPTLLVDTDPPQVNSPDDISFEHGAVGFAVNWSFSDEYPRLIEIITDNATARTIDWHEDSVSYSVDHLSHGVHNCTIRLTDWAGNQVSDTVRVIVMYSIFGGLGTPYVLISSILSVVAVAAVIVVMIKTRG